MSVEAEIVERLVSIAKSLLKGPEGGLLSLRCRIPMFQTVVTMTAKAEIVMRLISIAKSLLIGPKRVLLLLRVRMCFKLWFQRHQMQKFVRDLSQLPRVY